MRTNLIRIGACAIMLACVPAITKAQTSTSTAHKIFSPSDLLHIKTDSLVSPVAFPALDRQSASILGNYFNPKQLASDLKLPLNTKSQFLRITRSDLSNQTSNTSSSADNMDGYMLNATAVNTGIAIWDVPFSINYNNNNGWQTGANRFAAGNMQFDKDQFLGQVRDRIKKIANPEELFATALSGLYAKRDQAVLAIRNDLDAALKNSQQQLVNEIQAKVNSENISRQGIDPFMDNILKQSEASLAASQQRLMDQHLSPDSAQVLSTEVQEAIHRKDRLTALRDKWHHNGVAALIDGFEKEKQAAISQLMNDPAQLAKVAASKLKLSGMQKLLLHAKTFNLGSAGINQGDLTLKNALLKGASAEFLKGNRFLAPVLGAQPGIKNLTDLFYSNAQQLPSILTGGLAMGKGDPQKQSSHVSLFLYQPSNNQQFLSQGLQTALPKNFVATLSKRITWGASQSLLAEFSKSTSLYNNTENGGLKSIVSHENLLGNMGINLNYSGDFEAWGLNESMTVRYTGKEYSNLGNYALVSGSKEIANDVKKYFLKRKLLVGLRANYREYGFSTGNRKWTSFSYTADMKWKLNKGEYIEARYQPYYNARRGEGENYTSSKSYRLSLRGNVNRKIGRGFTYRNFIELAASKDNFYDFMLDQFSFNRMLSFTSLQTLAIGKQTLFINLTGNHAGQRTGYVYSNSSLSVDAGSTFYAGKTISLSSSLVYNGVTAMYRQLAIRQSVSTMIGKNLVVDGYLSVGHNLFKADFLQVPAISGNVSISYNLK